MEKDESDYLTTHEKWDLAGQPENARMEPIPTCLVRIAPRHSRTGLNEERGTWVKRFWTDVTENDNRIAGLRLGWSNVIYFTEVMEQQPFEDLILSKIRSSVVPDLKSLVKFSTISRPVETKIKEIDRMDLQLTSIDKGCHRINDA